MASQPLIANTNPLNSLHKKISFTTTNLSNGEQFDEKHYVTLLNGTYGIPLNSQIIQGNPYGPCIVIPLTTNSGNGSPYLKIHLPQDNESVMYITFSIRHNAMSDGYYDYIQGIPTAYRTALRNWIKDNKLIDLNSTKPTTKSLKFNVRGIDTAQISASLDFYVNFSAVLGLTNNAASGNSNA